MRHPLVTNHHVKNHTGVFEYNQKKIKFHFWSSAGSTTQIDTIIFLGSAQTGKIPKWVSQAAPPGVVVVEGMPHWHPLPTQEDLGRFTREYSIAVFREVLREFQIISANIVGLSQAAVSVIWLAQTLPALVRNVGIVAPLGLTAATLGVTAGARLKELKKRTLQTYLQPSQSLFRNPHILYMQMMLLRAFLTESEKGATNKKYALGASYDLLEDCRAVAIERNKLGFNLLVFLAEHDKIFPPHEVKAALRQGRVEYIETIILAGISHPSLASRNNRQALGEVISTIRQPKR